KLVQNTRCFLVNVLIVHEEAGLLDASKDFEHLWRRNTPGQFGNCCVGDKVSRHGLPSGEDRLPDARPLDHSAALPVNFIRLTKLVSTLTLRKRVVSFVFPPRSTKTLGCGSESLRKR